MQLTSLNSSHASLSARISRTGKAVSSNVAALSSGNRINRAADDVSGLSISTKMLNRTTSLRSAILNLSQADSLLQVADNAMAEQEGILQRMNTLAVMANSGALQNSERTYLDLELQSLKDEMDRIANETNFNGVSLLNKEFDPALAGVSDSGETFVSRNVTTGTAQNDFLEGTDANDAISTAGGNDTVRSGAGDDLITVSNGRNIINAGEGDDIMVSAANAIDLLPTVPITNGLVMQLDATNKGSLVTTGNVVDRINDLSGIGNDARADLDPNQGQVKTEEDLIGGNNSLTFDGSSFLGIADNNTINTGPSPHNDRTVMITFKTSENVSSRQVVYEQGGPVNGFSIYIEAGNLYVGAYKNNGAAFNHHLSTTIEANRVYTAGLSFNFGVDNVFKGFLNGEDFATVGITQAQNRHPDNIALGGIRDDTRFYDGVSTTGVPFKGQVGELLNYNQYLSSADIQQLQNYMIDKWGVPGAGAAYNNNRFIGGEGTDTLIVTGVENSFTLDGDAYQSIEKIDLTSAPTRSNVDILNDYVDTLDYGKLSIDASRNDQGVNINASNVRDGLDLTINASENTDIITGSSGTKIAVSYASSSNSVKVNLVDETVKGSGNDTLIGVTEITGSQFNDEITGSFEDDTLIGGNGDDLIIDHITEDGFVPAGGLVHRIDASQPSSIITAGTTVTQVNDVSGSGNNALADTGTVTYTNSTIGKGRALDFDGNSFLRIADTADINSVPGNLDERSVFVSFRTSDNIVGRQVIYESGGTDRGESIYIENGRVFVSSWDGNFKNIMQSAEVTQSKSYVVGFTHDSGTDNEFIGYINSKVMGVTEVTDPVRGSNQDIGIGGMNQNSQFNGVDVTGDGFEFEGTIGDVLIYNSALKDDNLKGLQNYLADRRLDLGGNDLIFGGAGNDTIQGGRGYDTIDGGSGVDVALFDGNRNQYDIEFLGNGSVRVSDRRADYHDNSDLLHNVEILRFNDGDVSVVTLLDEVGDIGFQVSEDASERLIVDLPNTTIARLFKDTSFNVRTQKAAAQAFDAIRNALDILTSERAKIGSKQSSVDILSTVNTSSLQNQIAARAVISDTDIAAISSEFALNTTKNQLSISMATQTNQLRETVVLDIINNALA